MSRRYVLVKLQNDMYDPAFLRLTGRWLNVAEAESSNISATFYLQLIVSFISFDRKLREFFFHI